MKEKIERLKCCRNVKNYDIIGVYRNESDYKKGYFYESTFKRNLSEIKMHNVTQIKENGKNIAVFFKSSLLENDEFLEKLDMLLQTDNYNPKTALIRMHKLI